MASSAAVPNSSSGRDLARDDELALGARLLEPALRGRFGFLAFVRLLGHAQPRRIQPADAAGERLAEQAHGRRQRQLEDHQRQQQLQRQSHEQDRQGRHHAAQRAERRD